MEIRIRKIQTQDDAVMAKIIRTVMPEFGATSRGFALHDPEVDQLSVSYSQPRHVYLVCTVNNAVIGGAGIAPLTGGDEDICELRKMYFLSEARGRGLGHQLLGQCINEARKMGFHHCYIETFNTMSLAMKLYERSGFKQIPGPLGNTGHFACDKFYLLDLKSGD